MLKPQSGVVLLLMALMLLIASATFALARLPISSGYYPLDEENALAKAKTHLLAYLIGHEVGNYRLPFPDRNGDPQGYDGRADCVTVNLTAEHRLGRYPWLGDVDPGGCQNRSLGIEFYDPAGEPIWYAVAEALLEHNDCQNRACRWLTLLNERGELISDRIAFLLISAGKVVTGQNRSAAAPNASAFLDLYQSGGQVESNADFDEVFIQAGVAEGFNDRLEFVTVDELPVVVQAALLQ
ncbi:MAG: hypothetical protein Q9O24_05790 [Gammaproteobacteria bacterium]|nr:hypothetical protein [Gammaproteobacteria bacterium]